MTTEAAELTAAEAEALYQSVNGLLEDRPLFSASTTISNGQQAFMVMLLVAVAMMAVFFTKPTGVVVVALAIALYLANLSDRLYLFTGGIHHSPELRVTDEEALAVRDEDLPYYTVLVPAFNEPDILASLVDHLGRIDYPRERMEIKLLLEVDDEPTIRAALGHPESSFLQIVLVPGGGPKTKPKACNFGLFNTDSDLVTIYDAEDIPDPLQLRRVAVAFQRSPDDVVCIQAKLKYHNALQNQLTRWFSSEYNQWFGYMLPGLMKTGAPIPLGGTSNHCKTGVLQEIGGWDPYNVTEDADLGMRIARLGYKTAMLDSITYEEANSDPINWIRQRSRWYKGYLQTFFVHARHPAALVRQLGWKSTLRFMSVTAGTPVISLINVVFWSLTIAWELGQPGFIRVLFPWYVFYPALISLVFGNFSMIYCGLVAARVDRTPQLLLACLTVPLYWLLMSAAAIKAFVQLIFQPSYWEKTVHGLDTHRRAI